MSYDLCPSLGSPVPTLVPYFGQKYHLRPAQTKEGLDWKKQQRICVYLQFYYLPACTSSSLLLFGWGFFRDMVSLCSPRNPSTHSVPTVLTSLKLRDAPAFASQVCVTTPSYWHFFLMKRHFMVYFNFRNSKYVQGHDFMTLIHTSQMMMIKSAVASSLV